MAKDYANILCEAVDEIVSQRLKDVSFDTTIECVIIDASEAEQGKYFCSNGSAKFFAFSENTKYKKDETVLVSIPQGDYNKQKTIISKQLADETQSVKFQKPFDTIVDTTTNLIKESIKTKAFIANQNYDQQLSEQEVSLQELWHKTYEEPLCGYTRLGLQGQFMSWLKSFNTKSGNYGLMARIVAQSKENATSDEEKEAVADKILNETVKTDFFANNKILDEEALENKLNIVLSSFKLNTVLPYIYILKTYSNKFLKYYNETDAQKKTALKVELKELLICQVYNLLLDCTDMFGNIYNYETFSEQEKVFDISNLDIFSITLYFYQNNNFYTYNSNGVKVAIPSRDEWGQFLNPNLFIKDPYICLGLALDSFDEDNATLYTIDKMGYNKKLTDEENTKNIQLRWVHHYEDEDVYSVINKETELDFDVRWYRYRTGAPSADQYSGMYWERTNLGITKTETRTETRTEEVELPEINNLTRYYLFYHYNEDGFSSATEADYIKDFKPPYKVNKLQNSDKPLEKTTNFSHMSYWTDEYLAQNHISKDFAKHSFVGQSTTSIEKNIYQSWTDTYLQGFIYHDSKYSTLKDYYMNVVFPETSGCMHRIGFWEKLTLSYRFYWAYPESFSLMLRDKDIWKTGGNEAAGQFDEFGQWSTFKGKNPYTELGYNSDNSSILLSTGFNKNFTLNSNQESFRKLLTLFADSFGEWHYVYDEYGLGDYVPVNEEIYAQLQDSLLLFYNKLDHPTYDREYEYEYEVFIPPDHFQYNFLPDTNLQEEQIKVIILCNDKIIRSNILRFTHDGVVQDTSVLDMLTALGIVCEDSTYGNYFIYSLGNELIDPSEKDEVRFLTATFDFKDYPLESTSEQNGKKASMLTEAEQITWYFPVNNTMIYPYLYNWSDNSPVNKIIEIPTNFKEVYRSADNKYYNDKFELVEQITGYYLYKENDSFPNPLYYNSGKLKSIILYNEKTAQIEITHFGSPEDNDYHKIPTNQANYMIKNYYSLSSQNNTIQCSIVKDRITYHTKKEMLFGPSGTSGTDVTLTINFNNNDTALTITSDSDGFAALKEGCVVNAKLYNQQGGMPIDLNNISNSNGGKGFTFDWDWLCAETTQLTKKYKQAEDFYPVIFTDENIENDDSHFYASVIYKQKQSLKHKGKDYFLTSDYYWFDRNSEKFIACDEEEVLVETNVYYLKQKRDLIDYKIVNDDEVASEYEPLRYFILYEGRYLLDDYFSYNPVLTYYEPVRIAYDYTTPYLEVSKNYIDSNGVTHSNQAEIKVRHDLDAIEKLTPKQLMNSVFILRLKLTGWGDYPLYAYKPIALRQDIVETDLDGNTITTRYDSITGNTHVIYNSAGDGVSYKEPFKLWKFPKIAGEEIAENGRWSIYIPHYEGENLEEKNQFIAKISANNILQPPKIYIENAPQYAVQFTLYDGETVVWTQPILTIQNNYPSEMLNNWNGKDIDINYEKGTILTSALSAGKKEPDNTFSGVVLGDWSRDNADASIKSQTGVYGFHHGAMSYALKEDGTAFLGKAGKGRIYLDGSKSQIYSSNWLNPNRAAPQGLLMDLDDGYLKMQNGGGLSIVLLNKNNFSSAIKDSEIFIFTNYLLRTEQESSSIPLDKAGNEIFKDKYGYLNATAASTVKIKDYFNSHLNSFYYPSRYAIKTITKDTYVPHKYYVYVKDTNGKYNYYLVPDHLKDLPSSDQTKYKDLLEEFNQALNSNIFFASYDFYIPIKWTAASTYYDSYKIEWEKLVQQETEEYNTKKSNYINNVKNAPIAQSVTNIYEKNVFFDDSTGLISNLDALDAMSDDYGLTHGTEAQAVIDHYRYWSTGKLPIPDGYQEAYGDEPLYQPFTEELITTTWDQYLDNNNLPKEIPYERSVFYSLYNGYQLVPSGAIYDPETSYFKESTAQYITLSSALNNSYPLAIGGSLSESDRNFKVTWDGTLYSTNGHFTGEINATSGSLGSLDVLGTLTGGSIYGAYIYGTDIEGGSITGSYIYGSEIEGAIISGSTIYFGQGEGWKYDVYDANGNYIRTRVYAEELKNTQVGGLTYISRGRVDASQVGLLQQATGDDNVGATLGVELAATSADYFLRIHAPGRILIKSTENWVALNAGKGWSSDKQGARVEVGNDGVVTLDGTALIFKSIKSATTQYSIELDSAGKVTINAASFELKTPTAGAQTGVYARFAPDSANT